MNDRTTTPQHFGFDDDEWGALELAASRSTDSADFAARVGQMAEDLSTEGSPAGQIVGGRFDVLMHWLAYDRAFADRLYDALVAS